MEKQEFKIALMIDSENVSPKYVKSVINEIAKYGKIIIARFYGDVSKLSAEWHQMALDYAIKPVHQYNVATGKNAADLAMALDAQEMMYQQKVNSFFLVTSDSDFTPLAMKLKEGGMHVIGVGSEKKVSSAFKNACNEFKYFEYLDESHEEEPTETTCAGNADIASIIKGVIVESGVDNKIPLSVLGGILVNRFSDFDPRKYGAKSLSALVNTICDLSIVQEKQTPYVVLKTKLSLKDIGEVIIQIINRNKKKEMMLTKIKEELEKMNPDFDFQELGFTRFSKLVASVKGVFVKDNKAILRN
ncbi:MAG TPA: NYN domain-containing protein [Bacilli bacterium]|nr:MAG: NYN domain protein [Tenericutes bacterium ADurb.BinA124]HNZ50547.1 NYN domain-containing protein [Bacilli bacterium]HOH18203.1 NYN domain-containing protein [Bacilli bacterium]HPN60949.1 NYN domain-containing protein [Bacilli bacterium]HPX84937.1 NYN domain-containing protein [Bacilli bacterium]